MFKTQRSKIMIRCNQCGERFILRGRPGMEGKVDTGFKQCICDNQEKFDITHLEE
ncbi:hypothetical protein ABE137_03505 [Brevibacillus laterosporus]|uniref:hypothetical protein n=1 Tax=Brevibacillus TaxID=55080 RepID=UPI0018D389CE|nr:MULTISPECIES: hypothetical protein [Brevibacillus]MDN9008848.1 hypothetical protein [Brevibacillus laterosporus]MDO0940955.1 hypothetical protein [Brevibacillus laterosporus]